MPGSRLIVSLLLIPGLISGVQAQEATAPLRLVSDLWCPYTCESDDAQRGILVDIVEEIFSQHGITISYQVIPWQRAKHSVEAGQADAALGLSKNYSGRMLSNTVPLTHDRTVLIWRKGQGQPYTGTNVLDGKKIGIGYAMMFDEGGELDQYIESRLEKHELISALYMNKHIEHLLKMLLSGRIDVIVEDLGAVQYQVSQGGLDELNDGLNSFDISATGKTSGLYVGFTPNAKGRESARFLDEGLLHMKDSGRLDAIVNSYRSAEQVDLIPLPESDLGPGNQSNTLIRPDK